jgi:hypothetical protein
MFAQGRRISLVAPAYLFTDFIMVTALLSIKNIPEGRAFSSVTWAEAFYHVDPGSTHYSG